MESQEDPSFDIDGDEPVVFGLDSQIHEKYREGEMGTIRSGRPHIDLFKPPGKVRVW